MERGIEGTIEYLESFFTDSDRMDEKTYFDDVKCGQGYVVEWNEDLICNIKNLEEI